MTYSATFVDNRVNNAEQFVESITESGSDTNIYITFGKVGAWANDLSPDVANSSISTVYEVWKNMIGGKKIAGSLVGHVVPRFNWTANTAYIAYDDKNPDLIDGNNQFYVITSDYNVYKCIGNNNGEISTTQPTATNPSTTTTTSDGYVWKFMYTVSNADQIRFMTPQYIPVKTLTIDDGSLQWQVQEAAVSGTLDYVSIANGGVLFTNSSNIVVTITGDGSSAAAIATINSASNTVNSVILTNRGTDYTYATVTITDSAGVGSGASARAVIAPPGGHGSNPLYELGGKFVVVNGRLEYDENGTFPVTNDFRQIALIKNPVSANTGNATTQSLFSQLLTLTTSGTGDYAQDEQVYQGASLTVATFKGVVVSWDSTTGKVSLINTEGTPTASQSLLGITSLTVRSVSSVTEPDLERYTGRILYVDNLKPVTRSSDQIENFKVVLKF